MVGYDTDMAYSGMQTVELRPQMVAPAVQVFAKGNEGRS